MIFITVGTHEQSFERSLKIIDELIDEKVINEEVFAQIGYTNYKPKNYKFNNLISYSEMNEYISKAKIIITHGGPASFLAPISIGKTPIVFPRKKEFNEHVNNHQVDFSKKVKSIMNNILVAENKEELKECIINYDKYISEIDSKNQSNN